MSLADKSCKPCTGSTPRLTGEQLTPMLEELVGWQVEHDKQLHKTIKTRNFQESLNLANKIGAIAESQQHHPDLLVRWGELSINLWTHAIDGLSEADFVLAAKIDQLLDKSL